MKVKFPAMKAVIGKREYFVTTMALSEIPRFFKFNDWAEFEPSQRAQRVLNETRVPEIVKYILDNEEGYIFSSITASFNSTPTFIPIDEEDHIGTLEMELENMEFVINDGQHRAAAIAKALKENPELGKDRISVLLFPMEDLDRLQQMFSDLNRFAHKTSKSLDILYDHRDNLSTLTKELEEQVYVFRGMLEKERMSIGLRSPKLITMSALYDANEELFGSKIEKPGTPQFREKLAQATSYWNAMAEVIEDWKRVKDLELAAQALRQEKINTHTVVLRALGGLGNTLFEHHPKDWRTRLLGLKDIDWRKSVGSRVNPLWDNVCIVAGSVVSNRQARVATQGALKDWLKVPLSNQENQVLTSLRQKGWVGSNGQPLQIELTLDKADSPNTSYGGDHNG
jgi:DNA sulfur modification protein DndB